MLTDYVTFSIIVKQGNYVWKISNISLLDFRAIENTFAVRNPPYSLVLQQ